MAVSEQQLKEISDGTRALCDWFRSQEISPKMATLVMANVIAAMMLEKTNNKDKLAEMYEDFGKLLLGVIEVTREFRMN